MKYEERFELNVFLEWRKLSKQEEGVYNSTASWEALLYNATLRWKHLFLTLSGTHFRQIQDWLSHDSLLLYLIHHDFSLSEFINSNSDLFSVHNALLAFYS